jgi:hypothetical protein
VGPGRLEVRIDKSDDLVGHFGAAGAAFVLGDLRPLHGRQDRPILLLGFGLGIDGRAAVRQGRRER